MLEKVTPMAWVLQLETLEAELKVQSDLYLRTLKDIASNNDFKVRTEQKIEELTEMLDDSALSEEMTTNVLEAIKTHQWHLKVMDKTRAQQIQTKADAEEMTLWIKELIDGLK